MRSTAIKRTIDVGGSAVGLVVVDSVGRAPNGKVDYKGVKALAAAATGVSA